MLNRIEAQQNLNRIIDSGILSAELTAALNDIVTCLNAEMRGYLIWGADDDCRELFTLYPIGGITEEVSNRLSNIRSKYSYTPSKFELEYTE